MPSSTKLTRALIDVAMGRLPADLVIQNGNWVSLNGQVVGGSYVYSAAGSTLAGPMWADAMRGIQDQLPYEDTPAYTGELDFAAVQAALTDAGRA